jgi:methionine synthase I (cobalamin-dependent)
MSRYARLLQRLIDGDVVILDGPTGTELERRGAPMDPGAWCGPTTLGNDRLLVDIHRDYIEAGADVITANTFASSRLMLGAAGMADRSGDIVTRAVAAARDARDVGRQNVIVAGSLSHMVPVARGAAAVDPARLPSETEMSDAFHVLAHQMRDAGCELIILEMMYHPQRIPLAVAAALSTGLPVWFGFSARRGSDGRVLSFNSLSEIPFDDIAALVPSAGVDVAGVMHTSAETVADALALVRRRFAGPMMAYPDSGYFEMPNWRFVDTIAPDRFASFCTDWIGVGAQVIGGCCGLGVEHIRAAARVRESMPNGGLPRRSGDAP